MNTDKEPLTKTKDSNIKRLRKPVEDEVGKSINPTIASAQETNELGNDSIDAIILKADNPGSLINVSPKIKVLTYLLT